jgi:hypothetical protein
VPQPDRWPFRAGRIRLGPHLQAPCCMPSPPSSFDVPRSPSDAIDALKPHRRPSPDATASHGSRFLSPRRPAILTGRKSATGS